MNIQLTRSASDERAETKEAAVLRTAITAEARRLGASIVGFAPVDRWAAHGEVPEGYRPQDLWPQARAVVSFGVPMLLPIIESTPSINYQEMYDTSNRLLDEISYRLSVWLVEQGIPAICLPRDGYGSLEVLLKNPFGSFSHTYAAKYAGLGSVGMSHNLLTPQWGPRIRLNSVFLGVDMDGDAELTQVCNGCGLCARLCPVNAIKARKGEILGDLDKDACTRHHIELKTETRWPCGVCVKVCPVGADRKLFDSVSVKPYRDEKPALEKNPDDPRFRRLVHMRRHGSGGDRIS
ncbi:4Fe-4S dicluster domain-containing protein [Telmatospirillum siberiense]|uniref:Epoxyqueuosine reductase n=1 Tax=Telmatospirillum siberiense TaxID=382514 RepID=A0A2N3PNZ1_9PROT|nr:4Fe-4S dicluster domain-containing protein [Telmatospirillum siberiense]PKU22107.1 epoxyqueuosine reductase [Telmatospirillum siberiense]